MYLMLSILQIHLHIHVHNINTLQLYTKLVYLKSRNSSEVQLKIYLSFYVCAKVELLQVYFRYTLNILNLKTDIIQEIILSLLIVTLNTF